MSLRSLSDQQILSRIDKLTQRERSLTLAVLLHLNEIERRKLHLKLGYSSLFDYCTSRLGYSASAASRRIRTARCVARFPEVYELLRANDVNVSTVAQVSRILTAENKDKVLARIRGKSQREVEAVVAEFEPLESAPKDRVRTVVVRVKAPALAAAAPAAPVMAEQTNGTSATGTSRDRAEVLGRMDLSTNEHDRNGCGDTRPSATERLQVTEAHGFERRNVVQFTASDEFMRKVELIRSTFWHQLPANATLEHVFELAMEFLIEKKDPARPRAERTTPSRGSRISKNARRVPAATRRAVHTRDEGMCTFVGPDGRRCGSRRALQIDHVKPVALGGQATANNLRLLCAYHNRFEADRLLGHANRENGAPPGMC